METLVETSVWRIECVSVDKKALEAVSKEILALGFDDVAATSADQLCVKAGVKPFGFHAIRHLAATILAYAGLDLPTVQSVLRHHNPNTTARYIKSLGVQQDKLEAVFVNRGQATVVDFIQKSKDVIIRRRADVDRFEKVIGT